MGVWLLGDIGAMAGVVLAMLGFQALTRKVEGFRRMADNLNDLHGRIRELDAQKNVLRETYADLYKV